MTSDARSSLSKARHVTPHNVGGAHVTGNPAPTEREFIGHKKGIPPRCERCRGAITWASWWHPRLNLYLCNEHSDEAAKG